MKASVLDLRRHMRDILDALDRNEQVELTYRGKKKAVIVPCQYNDSNDVAEHSAVGMWKDRDDMGEVDAYVRNLRKGRF